MSSMPDGSWPIHDERDLMHAISVWGRMPKPDRKPQVAAHLLQRAEELRVNVPLLLWSDNPITWECSWRS